MRIVVCVKQVPDTETKIKLKPDNSGIDEAGVKWVLNPYDEFAVEEALKLREKNAGSTVTVFSVGPKARVVETLRTALAMGADDAVVIDAPAEVDSFSVAKALAAAIKQEGAFDIVFTGKLAIDDNNASVSQQLAEFLSIPHTTVVTKFEYSDGRATVERETEGGTREVVQLVGASLVAANKGLNMPRYASLPGIMKAKKKPIKELAMSALGVASGDQKIKYTNFAMPKDKPAVKMIAGDAATQAKQLVHLLHDEAKIL